MYQMKNNVMYGKFIHNKFSQSSLSRSINWSIDGFGEKDALARRRRFYN